MPMNIYICQIFCHKLFEEKHNKPKHIDIQRFAFSIFMAKSLPIVLNSWCKLYLNIFRTALLPYAGWPCSNLAQNFNLLSLLLKTCSFLSFQIDLWNSGQDPSLWQTHFFLKEPFLMPFFFFLTCWREGFWTVNTHSPHSLITEVDLVIQPN